MRLGQQTKLGPARGVERTPERRRIVVEFDNPVFDAIRERAKDENTSFSEQVRILVQWGLDSLEGYDNG